MTTSVEKPLAILNAFTEGYCRLGLSINLRKTQILQQLVPGDAPEAPSIQINGKLLDNMEHFTSPAIYLLFKADMDYTLLAAPLDG